MTDVGWELQMRRLKRLADQQRRRKPYAKAMFAALVCFTASVLVPMGALIHTGDIPTWGIVFMISGFIALVAALIPLFWFDMKEIKHQAELHEADLDELMPVPNNAAEKR
jgi:hypothetical protein